MTEPVVLPHLVAGNLALDLANTISWRGTPRVIDYLANADGLAAWATAIGLIDSADAPALQAFDEVRALRAAIIAAGSAIAAGAVPDVSATATVARLAARSLAASSLEGVPASMAFAPEDQIVGPLAWAALDLFRGEELARLKQCPPDDCRWLFIDRTKNGSRRWCDMASCGNRAKARRSRE